MHENGWLRPGQPAQRRCETQVEPGERRRFLCQVDQVAEVKRRPQQGNRGNGNLQKRPSVQLPSVGLVRKQHFAEAAEELAALLPFLRGESRAVRK